MRAEAASPTYLAGLFSPETTAIVDPAKLVLELARACGDAGVRIYERTNVTAMDSSGAAIRFTVGEGTITAGQAVLATNVFPSLIVRNRLQTVPVYDYVLATEPLTDAQLDRIGWANRQGIGDCGNQFHYYRLSADNRIVWGGYDAVYHFGRKVKPAYEDRPASFRRLARISSSHLPQLDDVRFSHRWAGAIDTSTRFCAHWGWPTRAVSPTSTVSPASVSARRGSPPTSASTCSTVGRHRAQNWKWFVSGHCRFHLSRWPASESKPRDGRSTVPTTPPGGAICCCAHSTRSGSASIPERPRSVCKTFRLWRSELPTRPTEISKLRRVGYGEKTSGRWTTGCRLEMKGARRDGQARQGREA